jgi:hypothetical protein
MEYNFQGHNQTEAGEVVFLNETNPRATEKCKRMKAMLGDTINQDLDGNEFRGYGVGKKFMVCSYEGFEQCRDGGFRAVCN